MIARKQSTTSTMRRLVRLETRRVRVKHPYDTVCCKSFTYACAYAMLEEHATNVHTSRHLPPMSFQILHIRFTDVGVYQPSRKQHHPPGGLRFVFDVTLDGQTQGGVYILPFFPDDVPHLQLLLARCQEGGPVYLNLATCTPEEQEAFARAGLVTADAMVYDDPAALLGRELHKSLATARGVRPVWDMFLQRLPPAPPAGAPPAACVLLDFSPLYDDPADDVEYADYLLALPWEMLRVADAAVPLQEDGVVIVRRIAIGHVPARPPLVPSVIAVRPQFAVTPTIRQFDERALPQPSYGDAPFWCSLHVEPPGLTVTRLQEMIRGYEPHILHYFGHGDTLTGAIGDLRDVALLLDVPGASAPDPLRGLPLRLDLQSIDLRLLVLFACQGADPLPDPDRLDRYGTGSLVRLLTGQVPAILAMQTVIQAPAAAEASRALYPVLAEGRTLFDAVLQMRRALYRFAQESINQYHGNRHAWWVPALYISDPAVDRPLARPADRAFLDPLDAPPPSRLIDRRPLLEQLLAAVNNTQIVEVIGDRNSGRTTLLQRALAELRQQQVQCIALRARPPRTESASEYVKILQREIVCYVNQNQRPPPYWADAHEAYVATLASCSGHDSPLYILLDNLDDLLATEPRALKWLIPDPLPCGVRCVITRKREPLPGLASGDIVEVPPFTRAQLEEITRHTFGDYLQRFAAERMQPAFEAVETILFTLPGPLPKVTVVDLVHEINPGSGIQEVTGILQQLVDAGFVQIDQDTYTLASERYRKGWWLLPDTDLMRHRLLPLVRDHLQRPGLSPEKRYPAEVLHTLADPLLLDDRQARSDLLPPPDSLDFQRPPRPYRVWHNLARAYQQHGMSNAFRYPARAAQHTFRCSAMDRAVLELLIFLLSEQRPVPRRDALWGAICDDRRSLLATWLEENSNDPLAIVFKAVQRISRDEAPPDSLITALNTCPADTRTLALHWVVAPLLAARWPPGITEALNALLDNHARLQLALILAAAARGSPAHPALVQARRWFEQLRGSEPDSSANDALRALWIAILPAFDMQAEAKAFHEINRDMLRRSRTMPDPPPERRAMRIAEEIVLRHVAETGIPEPWPFSEGWIETTFVAPALRLETDDEIDSFWRGFVAGLRDEGRYRPETLDRAALVYVLCCTLLNRAPRGTEMHRHLAERITELRPYTAEVIAALGRWLHDDSHVQRTLAGAARELLATPLGFDPADPALVWLPRIMITAPQLCGIWYDAFQEAARTMATTSGPETILDTDLSASNPHLDRVIESRLDELLDSSVEYLQQMYRSHDDFDLPDEDGMRNWINIWKQRTERFVRDLLATGLR